MSGGVAFYTPDGEELLIVRESDVLAVIEQYQSVE